MKNKLRQLLVLLSATSLLVMAMVYQVDAVAPGPKVSAIGNKHNLSLGNTDSNVKYKASGDASSNPRGTEICIFCHTPHNANVDEQAPLWNRSFSTETFQRYSSASLIIRRDNNPVNSGYTNTAQPNGSTRLCLSCHDGVSRLGAVKNGPEIPMLMSYEIISGIASFKPDTGKMKTGHHPVSFVYNAAVKSDINSGGKTGYVLPSESVDPAAPFVMLDKLNRMQCVTCHNVHQNQSDDALCYSGSGPVACDGTYNRKIAPFWVYHKDPGGTAATDQEDVCNVCHPMSGWTGWPP